MHQTRCEQLLTELSKKWSQKLGAQHMRNSWLSSVFCSVDEQGRHFRFHFQKSV